MLLSVGIEAYVPIFLLIIVGVGLGFLLANLSWLIGPSRPNAVKESTYESGMDPVGSAHERFSVKFYLVAMLFILFDIEVVFMYPWASQYRQLLDQFGMFPFIEMLIFVLILLVGYIYVLRKGGLRWS
ncbi:MAG: NADH-quinone oxidoreductase subunit A [Bacteroidia bacterium]|jgi:NADH-quinone oxidoreductase subunit A|nr:NADH-quinone oxidoreductase subunit A [Bacteroidia bacterium]